MLKVTCKTCGKQVIWDDFKPTEIRCPNCGDTINVHASLKDNIEQRESIEAARVKRCPSCRTIVSRLWFIRCPGCNRWILGSQALSGKWFSALMLILAYLALSTLYFVYIR